MLVDGMEQLLESNSDVSFERFVYEFTLAIMEYQQSIEEAYEDFELKVPSKIKFDPQPIHLAQIRDIGDLGFHTPDDAHLAAAVAHKIKNLAETVFVTTDYGIIENKALIVDEYGLNITNPVYAINFFKL